VNAPSTISSPPCEELANLARDTAAQPDLAVVVPVRRGSSRIAEKCALPFGGEKTLVEWKLKQLIEVIEPSRIFLSSEDDRFLASGARLGVSLHKRPKHLAIGHVAPFCDVITGIVSDIPHAHIAWCTVVCPLMAPADYRASFQSYQENVIEGKYDSLVGVTPAKEYFWSDNGPLNYEASRNHTISQDLPNWHRVTNSVYMASKELMIARQYFLGERVYLQTLPKLAGVDIDVIEDYHIACAIHGIYAAETSKPDRDFAAFPRGLDDAA